MDSIIIFCAKYLIVLVGVLWVAAWYLAPRNSKMRFILATVLAGIIALILSRIAGKLYFDPRPFVREHVTPLISHAPDNGFPSDHALLTMTLTAVTYFFSKKIAYGMLAATILVGVARVLAKVHSPIDIAGAWVLGVIGAIAGFCAANWAWKHYIQKHEAGTDIKATHD